MQQSTEPQATGIEGSMAHDAPRINCVQLVEAITDYLDDAMDPDDRERLEFHLSLCPPCKVYLDQMRVTIAATGRLRTSDVSPHAQTVLMEMFRAWANGD